MTTVYIVLLLTVNAFFVAAEFALVKVPMVRVIALAERGRLLGRLALRIKTHLEPYLAACQLGITMASLGLGWIGEPAVAALLEPAFRSLDLPGESLHIVSFLVGFVLFSSLHIVIGEQVPKTYAIHHAERVAMWCAVPLMLFYYLVFPLNWLLNKASVTTLRTMGVKEVSHVDILTGAEIRGLIDASSDHGVIASDQAEMLQNLFRFEERVVHSVMLPRSEVDYVLYDASAEEIIRIIKETRHTRLPVIDGTWDDLKGVLMTKDVLIGYLETGSIELDKYLRPPQLVPGSQALRLLFEQMRSSHEHLAFAVDEFGQVDGLITLEDILEEVVGDIRDETDLDDPGFYIYEEADRWRVHGLTPLHDLTQKISLEVEFPPGASTLSGYLMQRLQKIPAVNDHWEEDGYRFTVTRVERSRVEEALIQLSDVSPSKVDGE